MSRLLSQFSVVAAGCLLAAGNLWADDGAAKAEPVTTQAETAPDLVWVGVRVFVANQEENDYLIGTLDKKTLDQIELDRYDRRFLRLSNLRIEEEVEDATGNETLVHYDCKDQLDWGIMLIQYKDILSIELKKCDPLSVQ